MPNQLSQSKRRASLAEHEAVLDALSEIARLERTSVMDLLREGARRVVKSRLDELEKSNAVRSVVWACAPKMPAKFRSSAQVVRFKRRQREFDSLIQEMQVAAPEVVQRRNSIASSRRSVRVIDFADGTAG